MAEIVQNQDTRRAFIDTLIELAEKDDKIVLIVPDVGFNYIEKFKEKFPKRFFNFGVTEQSTIMIAVGLALSGFKPWVYSMINFVLFRPYEMVRNGIIMHKANVKLLGVKGSSSYKFLGFSHNMTHSEAMCKKEENFARAKKPSYLGPKECVCSRSVHNDEDARTCRNLDLKYYIPQTTKEVKNVIMETYKTNNPVYIRL